jgi:voltage-gated potassium channel
MAMILSNLFIAIFETFDASKPYQNLLDLLELITVIGFTIEYILRVWTAGYLYPSVKPAKAAFKYMTSFNGVIDILSCLPYYLPIFFPTGVVAFRIFRIVRILRLFRINAYYDALNVIGDVIKGKKDQLMSSIFIIFILMMASSLCMYSLEHEAQPEVFQNAFSGFWWAVSTLLTVGYGDIYPITIPGRLFGICITFLGVGMVAIPTGILSAGFVEQYTKLKSMNDYSLEEDIRFVRIDVQKEDSWNHKQVKELELPAGLILATIQRDHKVIVPRGHITIQEGDQIVLGAKDCHDDMGIVLKELVLKERHPWTGCMIKEIDISRQTLIVMVKRDEKVLIPSGSLKLLAGDMVVLYTRKSIKEATDVEV